MGSVRSGMGPNPAAPKCLRCPVREELAIPEGVAFDDLHGLTVGTRVRELAVAAVGYKLPPGIQRFALRPVPSERAVTRMLVGQRLDRFFPTLPVQVDSGQGGGHRVESSVPDQHQRPVLMRQSRSQVDVVIRPGIREVSREEIFEEVQMRFVDHCMYLSVSTVLSIAYPRGRALSHRTLRYRAGPNPRAANWYRMPHRATRWPTGARNRP